MIAQVVSASQLAGDFSTNVTSYVNSSIPILLTIFGVFLGLGILYTWGRRSTGDGDGVLDEDWEEELATDEEMRRDYGDDY